MTNRNRASVRLDLDPYQERLLALIDDQQRQACQAFTLARFGITTSLFVVTAGCVLLLMGKATEGTVNTVSGALSIPFFFQVAKDAREELDQLTEDLKALRSSAEP